MGIRAGADPGEIGAFGVAVVDESGTTSCATVSSVSEAATWVRAQGTVQSVNFLRGTALARGALLASWTREEDTGLRITEVHPKALLLALDMDGAAFAERFDIRSVWGGEEHQPEAAIAACAPGKASRRTGR